MSDGCINNTIRLLDRLHDAFTTASISARYPSYRRTCNFYCTITDTSAVLEIMTGISVS